MSVITLFCFFLCLAIIVSAMKRGADIFSPARIFGFIWCLAIGLADMKLSRFQVEWSFYGWLMLLLSVSSFLIGVFVIYVLNINKRVFSIQEVRKKVHEFTFNNELMDKLIIFLFILYIISYIVNTIATGYVPIFSRHPSESRTDWGIFGFGLLTHAAPSILFFIIQLFLFSKPSILKKIILINIFIITFLTYFFLLQRFDLALFLVISIVFIFYSSNKLRPRNLLFVFGGFTGFMYLVTTIRMSKYFTGYLYVFSRMKFSPKYAIFTEPYMYISMNLENFARVTPKLETNTFGFFTFNFVTSLAGIKHLIKDYARITDYPYLTSGYNTYSMFFDFFRDFNVIGIVFIPFAMGAIISNIYYWMRSNPNLNTISLYAVMVFVMLISFFINAPGQLHFFFNTCLIFVVTRLVMRNNETYSFFQTKAHGEYYQ
jgi:oligosaccharide repeat unit polymerase